jgi:hypothetical protein
MQIGPFRIEEVERIKDILEGAEIPFEMFIDEDLKEKILNEFNHTATIGARGSAVQLDLRIVFFEIDGSQFDKVKDEMEKMGIAAPSDGSYELAED